MTEGARYVYPKVGERVTQRVNCDTGIIHTIRFCHDLLLFGTDRFHPYVIWT